MVSECCKSPVRVIGNKSKFFICNNCGEGCDLDYKKHIKKELKENKNIEKYL